MVSCKRLGRAASGRGEVTYVKLLHCLDVLLGRLVGFRIGIIQFVTLEVSCSTGNVSKVKRRGLITYELAEFRDDPRSCL
jgi:hypothetical protein